MNAGGEIGDEVYSRKTLHNNSTFQLRKRIEPLFSKKLPRLVGLASAASFVLPTWITFSILGVEADLRVWIAAAAVVAIFFRQPRTIFNQLRPADFLVAFLCGWQTYSEWSATGAIGGAFVLSYGYWILPYVVGRCSAKYLQDLQPIAICIAVVCIVFATSSLVELVTRVDFFETVFGTKPGMEFHPRFAMRWGFVRTEGAFRHPIFYGIVLMLLLPWSVWMALDRRGWWRLLAVLGCCATLFAAASTISRGPILGIAIATVVTVFIRFRKLMFVGTALTGFALILAFVQPERLEGGAHWFARLSGEQEHTVEIHDEVEVKTSTTSRLLVLRHYQKSLWHAGVLGYGMSATDVFPPNVPFVPFDKISQRQFKIVDNSYVLLALRGGWLMPIAFFCLHMVGAWQFAELGRYAPDYRSFGRIMAGVIWAHAIVVFTVYPDFDFMFVFLWSVGLSSVRLDTDR